MLAFAVGMLILAFYVGGFLAALFLESEIGLNPVSCVKRGLTTSAGLKCSVFAIVLFAVTAVLIMLRGKGNGEQDERNFEISDQGTYGTAGFMKQAEQQGILKADEDTRDVKGIIFGKDLESGKILSLPVDSRLNRNIAVCGSQGSMKSRAFARVMALQCVRRGESMYITDPKSELYEDLCAYLKDEGYTVKQLNLIQLIHSDAWNCLAEIDEGELIDVFCDVVIRNTTDKFDHFYDNVEMDLLKALCLYVYEEYPPEQKTFPEAYKLLLNKSVEALDVIFERLPGSHPAKGPYQLFAKAEKVKGNAVLGLGTRLQILQNKLVQQITSHTDIDLTLPGREKCAYFCITSDQDSTYDMLATLFTSFLSIKLVRFADRTEERRLPIPMNFILDEFPNIGVVPDFKKKLATARSRNIGMSILFQNIPQLQNRYPDNQWEEILGGCDFSIFLGCNDMTTASYFSDRTGEVTVSVSSIRKNYYTIRATDYVPEYTESTSVGKRQLLLPDEVLRYPLDRGLLIIRGQKVLRFRKMDYTEHADAQKLRMEKVETHIPDWYVKWEQEKQQFSVEQKETEETPEQMEWEKREILEADAEVPKKERRKGQKEKGSRKITKVEDLFSRQEGGDRAEKTDT
ncbi:MAG: VirD4-like conjugal transfer protein, CD1115 family [Marvinbryantia sp.]|uniref:VirD4-like conjugal transfer protein, CD1115 family n=1 Tax=Marvinbryantia sp. TaxID=2496532 RepID=UPI003999D43C